MYYKILGHRGDTEWQLHIISVSKQPAAKCTQQIATLFTQLDDIIIIQLRSSLISSILHINLI